MLFAVSRLLRPSHRRTGTKLIASRDGDFPETIYVTSSEVGVKKMENYVPSDTDRSNRRDDGAGKKRNWSERALE